MKTAFIATVFNEEKSIREFLHSLFLQSKLPNEIVIVDGGSKDKTVQVVEQEIKDFKRFNKKVSIKFLQKKGNRAVGRNFAIENSTADIICCSDAGCILDKDWLLKITEPFTPNPILHSVMDAGFRHSSVDVIAGFYKGLAGSVFEKSLIPYVLVMPDKVNPQNFLPATRSMAFTKKIWEKAGKFPEDYSHNEDYIFARNLKKCGANIEFSKNAIVGWVPRNSISSSFNMFYRFAKGDAEAKIFRPKVLFIFLRYLFVFILLDLYVTFHRSFLLQIILVLFLLYIAWTILKNYKYVKNWKGLFYLPIIQFTSDFAVIVGSVRGFIV